MENDSSINYLNWISAGILEPIPALRGGVHRLPSITELMENMGQFKIEFSPDKNI